MGSKSHKKYTDRNYKPFIPTSRIETLWWTVTQPKAGHVIVGTIFAFTCVYSGWKRSIKEVGKREFMRHEEEKVDKAIEQALEKTSI